MTKLKQTNQISTIILILQKQVILLIKYTLLFTIKKN